MKRWSLVQKATLITATADQKINVGDIIVVFYLKLLFKLKVSLTFFYFWLGSAKEEEKRTTTKFSPLNASVALIKKPVNWFAQHSKSIDWFLYRGATLAFNGLNQTVVNMLFMLLKTFKTFFIRVLILQYPYDFEISEWCKKPGGKMANWLHHCDTMRM